MLATDWWVAGPTIAAAAIAAAALVVSAIAQRGDVRTRRTAQAKLVNSWAIRWRYEYAVGADPFAEATIVVNNASDLPAYSVELSVMPWDWTRGSDPILTRVFATLRPHQETKPENIDRQFPAPPPLPDRPVNSPIPNPPLRLTFHDASGRRWRRWPDGKLEEL